MKAGTRKPGGRPTQKQAAELDAQILDGARSVFCRSGVANASLDEIALTLGVSKHTIYRRYPNKAALLEAVVKRDLGRFREALEASASAAAGPLDALRRVALRYVEIGASRDYAAFYLSVSAEAALSGPLRERLGTWSQTALEPLGDAVTAAQAAGQLQAEHPATMGAILVDLLEGANNRVRLAGDGPTGKGQELLLFEQRWAVFLAAFGAKRGL
jgi:AcrR family transcriptional regulator